MHASIHGCLHRTFLMKYMILDDEYIISEDLKLDDEYIICEDIKFLQGAGHN